MNIPFASTLFCLVILTTIASPPVLAAAAEKEATAADPEEVRKITAVALNYCRASLHRIRRTPEKHIFHEEQQRILNNLDLNRIEDPEVITLYKSILEEIGQVQITERERTAIDEQFRRNTHRQLSTSFFVVGAQVITGQLGGAIQSGANSWWDFRNQQVRRDSDNWKVEKSEFTGLMSRSSAFLDSFWRLSQKNEIPDRWLIRDQDLDQMTRVLAERNAAQRLRMLSRMERFMECYPPYWYYVARTQQQLGMIDEATKTYQRLSSIGSGHFRQDDMLASSMANLALLQEQQGLPEAADTAMRVMDYSIRNWESNLICAWVLGRHQRFDDAEELILCNLDEDREAGQSRVALASLYYHSKNATRLAELLSDERVVHDVPIPGLLLCARMLGAEAVPKQTQRYLASTLSASIRRTSQGAAVTLSVAAAWKLRDAKPEVAAGQTSLRTVRYRQGQGGLLADFMADRVATEDGSTDTKDIRVTLNYPGTPAIHVRLEPPLIQPDDRGLLPTQRPFSPPNIDPRLSFFSKDDVRYRISEIELDGVRLSFRDDAMIDARGEAADKELSAEEAATRS
ncbi:MAG: hypothetical protein GY878_01560 [Fuerstiella sp.]|nr:hypothetical protein [Fuerstiella sp.]